MAEWTMPAAVDGEGAVYKGLKVLNTLTQSKVEFVPKNGNRVNWYICGPTVYDSAHLGHARAYLSFDIIRRVLEDYFGYDVFCVMNITDIDDKIILRARQHHFFNAYVAEAAAKGSAGVMVDVSQAAAAYGFEAREAEFADDASPEGVAKMKLVKASKAAVASVLGALEEGAEPTKELLDTVFDVVSEWLDGQFGSGLTDASVFAAHARQYETEYMEDMAALGIRPPHALTRVSEYVTEIVEMAEKIVAKGLGYESNGSVYFNTGAFIDSGHEYCKLAPGNRGNVAALRDGEGALAGEGGEKQSPVDFALWKASKPGEPGWESPWGRGRPGWHIECSAMAGAILGEHLDIHGGGEDLKFPHHDNELAQSEAYFGVQQWTSYFLHAGHLHIEGSKMSKSLKNFETIRQALDKYSPRQIRLLFLLHAWEHGLDYSEGSMQHAKDVERKFREFFLNVSALVREATPDREERWGEHEFALEAAIATATDAVDAALKDSFDTPSAMLALSALVTATNTYRATVGDAAVRPLVLMQSARFVARILCVFGVIDPLEATATSSFGFQGAAAAESAEGTSVNDVLDVLSAFRDAVRAALIAGEPAGAVLALSDQLRDDILPELGVRLEDRESGKASIKLDDRDVLLAERAERVAQAEARAAAKAAKAAKAAAKAAEREDLLSTPPNMLFKRPEYDGMYSAWNDEGVPVADGDGEPLSKAQTKKVAKAMAAHVKKHQKWLAAQASE